MIKKTTKSRRLTRTAAIIVAAGASLTWIAGPAIADQVVLRDGTVYNGTIISENRREVVIETEIRGIQTRMTLNARDVRSTKRTPLETAPSSTSSTTGDRTTLSIPKRGSDAEKADQPLKRDGYQLLMEIPLSGTFGQDIYPLAVSNSLEWAIENGVTDIVFRINSPGGEVWAAQDMVAVMERHSDDLTYHMLIEHAISASIWPAFWCDTISMAPGGDFGGAVVYSQNSTGSAEVDKKMTSIMASKLGSAAEANGHSSYLVNAMMLSEAEVYAHREKGEWVLSNSTHNLPKGYEIVDGPNTVLTLKTKEAAKWGIVTALESKSLEDFAAAHGFEKWDSAGEMGTTITTRDIKKCKSLRKRLDATIQSFQTDIAQYGNSQYITFAGAALQSAKKNIGLYKRIMKQANDMEMPSIVDAYDNAIDVVYWETQIEDYLADLRRVRRLGP
ncbi:MAG: hypothetical protein AB8C13_07540 [Phycisphaerales bacterium]